MKAWVLVQKDTKKIIKIGVRSQGFDMYVVAFETKKGLINAIDGVIEDGEEIRKIDIQNPIDKQ